MLKQSKTFSSSFLKKGEKDEDDKDMVYCTICKKGFFSNIALSNHARMEHIDSYIADPKVWSEKQNEKKYHINSKLNINKEEVNIKTKEFISSLKPIDMTSLMFEDVKYLIIKNNELEEPKRDIDKNEENINKNRHERKEKKHESNKKYIRKKKIINHPIECLEESPPTGETCNMTFSTCCEYSIHYGEKHMRRHKISRCQVCEKFLPWARCSDAPFNCDICDKGFNTAEELSEHNKTTNHVKLKPFKCGLCHKRFSQKGNLLIHIRIHTGEKPYECTHCDKCFVQKSNLIQHLASHTKDKRHKCVICGKGFSLPVYLKQHMRVHRDVCPYVCEICDKTFKQKSQLNIHLRNVHLIVKVDENPYKCKMCNTKFKLKMELDSHMATHNTIIEVQSTDDEVMEYEVLGHLMTSDETQEEILDENEEAMVNQESWIVIES